MISAFGVEHTIAKSFVSPGAGKGGFVAAKDLTPGMRNVIRTRIRNKGVGAGGTHTPGLKVKGQSSKGRQIYDDEHEVRSMNRRVSTDVMGHQHSHMEKPGEQLLGFSKPNGRGGGILRMNLKADPESQAKTYKHEMAHLTPKRNPVRFFERVSDPKRLGREEGRADFVGNGKKTPGEYPGSDQFQRGYNQVQRRMAEGAARRSKNVFTTNAKGETVLQSQKRRLK